MFGVIKMGITIREALLEAASFLRQKGVILPRMEAEIILAFLLNKERHYLYAHGEAKLGQEIQAAYRRMLERRGEGFPLAYLTGEKEFMGLNFGVNENVLIPRPETEHLVEGVLKWCRSLIKAEANSFPLRILDLGTGCGNIAISLAYYLPFASVTAVDLDMKAISLARMNADNLGVAGRINFLCGSFWEPLSPAEEKFHVIVSNPPYIPRPELAFLPREVQYEPPLALNGGSDGLEAYRIIFSKIELYLASPGLLALEIGADQAANILKLGSKVTLFQDFAIIKDYSGRERVILFTTGSFKGFSSN